MKSRNETDQRTSCNERNAKIASNQQKKCALCYE